jgi:hypothetical protein
MEGRCTLPTPIFTNSTLRARGHRYKLNQEHVQYNLTKYAFTNRVVTLWNNSSDFFVSACSVLVFEKRLDFFLEGPADNF